MNSYKIITEEKDLRGKRVLLRVDLNVPVSKGKISNDFRIKKTIPTINFLRNAGAKIIILSHFGRDPKESLEPISEQLNSEIPLKFVPDIFNLDARNVVDSMQDGEVVLFENLRRYEQEESNDPEFVAHLASFGDVYVNEAFSVAHRDHASITGLAKVLPSYAGIRLDEEVSKLSKSFDPPRPFLLIVGGAKFETKLPLIKKFTTIADKVFIAGALANDVYRFYGLETGKSLVSDTPLSEIAVLLDTERISVPEDVVLFSKENKLSNELSSEDIISDAGSATVITLSALVKEAKFIVWNGPLGLYEDGFTEGTDTLMKMIVNSDAESIVGGGDTGLAASKFENFDEKVFVSTGGGAMLDFLSEGSLVGIDALNRD